MLSRWFLLLFLLLFLLFLTRWTRKRMLYLCRGAVWRAAAVAA